MTTETIEAPAPVAAPVPMPQKDTVRAIAIDQMYAARNTDTLDYWLEVYQARKARDEDRSE